MRFQKDVIVAVSSNSWYVKIHDAVPWFHVWRQGNKIQAMPALSSAPTSEPSEREYRRIRVLVRRFEQGK